MVRRGRAFITLILVVLSAWGLVACASTGSFVWVDQLPDSEIGAQAVGDYVIGRGDVLTVRVYGQDAISTKTRVRDDGRISMPLVGDVLAQGKRPAELAKSIEAALKPFIVAPSASVIVEESQGMTVSVIGEVQHAGIVNVEPGSGVLQALAAAGGLTEFADRDEIFVFRKTPRVRVRFTWERLTQGVGKGAAFALRPGDVVVVE